MVKMKIYSDSEDHRISKLNEFFLVADMIRKVGGGMQQGFGKLKGSKLNPSGGGEARAPSPTSNGSSIIANRSFDPPAQGPCETFFAPSSSLPGDAISTKGKNASQTPTASATLGDLVKCQLLGKAVEVDSPRSDGKSREGCLQRSSSPTTSLDTTT
jgi:hypothetical protein